MSSKESFAARLKLLRQEKGITQKQLADELQISLPAVIHYENANRFPGSAVLTLLSQFFSVNKEYLTGESDEREAEYAWDDPEIMEAVRESLPAQISGLNDVLKDCPAQEQKLTFDILVQLRYVLELKDTVKKMTALSMLHDVAAAVEHLAGEEK